MFGELDRRVIALQHPFKTILLSHKQTHGAKSKGAAQEKKENLLKKNLLVDAGLLEAICPQWP